MCPAHVPAAAARGPLIAIGGAEDKAKERVVLRQLTELAGGPSARVAVIATASSMPAEISDTYARVFRDLGAAEIIPVSAPSRAEGNDPALIEALERATCVFFTGGEQLRLVATLGGTALVQGVRRLNARGIPVAGTSAGAGALCQHMIGRGKSGQFLGQHMVTLAPGLGLTNRIIVDQHFSQRHRVGRLFSAVALNPFLFGVGIDEDTAACLSGDNRLTVWGRGSVTVVDGSAVTYTDVYAVESRAAAAVLGLRVHILTAGCSFDLMEHTAEGPQPLPPHQEPQPQANPESSGRAASRPENGSGRARR